MKKGRAGVLLTAIVPPLRIGLIERIIFQHSSAIGIRRSLVDRHKLPRRGETVQTRFGPVRGKVIGLPDGQLRFTVEDDDARALAHGHQTTAAEIRRHAEAAWHAAAEQDPAAFGSVSEGS
jgi:uncharacterized protein (DUF111 family)